MIAVAHLQSGKISCYHTPDDTAPMIGVQCALRNAYCFQDIKFSRTAERTCDRSAPPSERQRTG